MVLLICLNLTMIGLGQEREEVVVDNTMFALTLQEGWEREPAREDFGNAYMRVSSPDGIDEGAIYLQLFPKGRFTPQTYQRAVRRYVKERMEGSILAESEVTVNGRSGWRVEYEGNSVGYVGARRHFLNTVFFLDDRIAVVHCAAQSDQWEVMREFFLATSDSFETADR